MTLTHFPPPHELSVEEVIDAMPRLRQSLLSKYDDCALSSLMEMRFSNGWSTHPQAAGTVFHLFAAMFLRELMAVRSRTLPVQLSEQLMVQACRQEDVPARDIVRVPMRKMPELRMAARKFASDNQFSYELIVDVERRLSAKLTYPHPLGGLVERELTGQIDALLEDKDDPDGAVVIDWKHTWGLPPEPKEKDPDARSYDDDELNGLSYHGYFQQRFYGWLVMKNYPKVQRVTLREFYGLKTAARKATLTRAQMPSVEEELSILAQAFDEGMMQGSPPWPFGYWPVLDDAGVQVMVDGRPEREFDISRLGRFKPQPGKHCLAGETRILTDTGSRSLAAIEREMGGRPIRVLDRHGRWSEATVQKFGQQPLVCVTFDDGTVVRATPDHRWWTIAKNERGSWEQTGERVTTMELERAPLALHAEMPDIDPVGVCHGFVFGDGWIRRDRGTAVARIMPHDADVVPWFVEAGYRVVLRPSGERFVYGLPAEFKSLPLVASPAYARGFIAGLHAADGKVDRHGGVLIHQEGERKAHRIAELARLGGCVVSSVRVDSAKPTNFSAVGTVTREMMAVRLKPATAPVLKDYHRERLRETNQMRRMYRRVVSVEPDGFEEVYCAVVPGAESFTLASGIVTSNCGFCARARDCPIDEDTRIEQGAPPATAERARGIAGELQVVEKLKAKLTLAAKAYVELAGEPIPVRDSKGRRMLGWYKTKRGRRFGFYTPNDSDRGGHADIAAKDLDAELAGAMREATARARRERPARGGKA